MVSMYVLERRRGESETSQRERKGERRFTKSSEALPIIHFYNLFR